MSLIEALGVGKLLTNRYIPIMRFTGKHNLNRNRFCDKFVCAQNILLLDLLRLPQLRG